MNIKIVKTELNTSIKKKDGGQYNGHKVTYEDEDEVKSKGFHESILENNQDLKLKIESLKEGKLYDVKLEKVEKGGRTFWNWVDITPSSETSAQTNKSQQSGTTKNFDNVGVGVGHGLTNAVNICAAMGDADREAIKKYAYMIYDLSLEMQREIREGTRTDNTEF